MSADTTTPRCPLTGQTTVEAFNGHRWQMPPDGRFFQYRESPSIHLLFCDPIPEPEEIRLFYDKYYDYAWFHQHRHFKRVEAWHRFRRLVPLLQLPQRGSEPTRLLDAGCGHGWFLEEACRRNWEAWGVDYLSAEVQEALRRRGVRIHHGSIFNAELPRNYFDIVTLWHVLEHVATPRELLQQCAILLRDGGYCVIAVPNRESLGLQKAGIGWGWLQEPFVHIFCFSAEAIKTITPPDLEVLAIHSRDTWGQQLFFYTPIFRAYLTLLRLLFRGPAKLFRILKLSLLAVVCDKLHFCFYEAAVLIAYAVYCLLRTSLFRSYERNLRASELLVVLQKKPAVKPRGDVGAVNP